MRHFTTQALAEYICINLYAETKLHTFMFKEDLVIFASSKESLLGKSFPIKNASPSPEDDIMLFSNFFSLTNGGYISITYKGEPVFTVAMEGELTDIRTVLRMILHFVRMWLGFREHLLNIEQKHKQILENIKDGYYEVDLNGNLTFFNSALRDLLGYNEFELIGMNFRNYVLPATAEKVYKYFVNVYQTKKPSDKLEFQYIKKTGEILSAEVSINLIYNEAQAPVGFCGIVRDITERKQAEKLINFYAYHDPLTELPNRRYFEERLTKAIKSAKDKQTMLAVLFLDLDGFKQVNDTLGHSSGDKLLKLIANRLTKHVNKRTIVSRLGGDEFTILIKDLHNFHEAYVETKSILELFQQQFTISNVHFNITASIGAALFPDEGLTAEELMMNADMAMYNAKQNGKNTFRFFGHLNRQR